MINTNAIRDKLSFSTSRRQITIGIICLILGFGLVTQLKVQGEASQRLASQPESDLTEIIDKQDAEIRALRAETTDLQVLLVSYEASSKSRSQILAEAQANLDNMRILIGRHPVAGRGVEIEIRDKNGYLTGFDIRQLVEELRASGAQAIAIGGHRVVANTSFARRRGDIYLDKYRLTLPYRIQAIGDAEVLKQSILLPRGIKDKLSAFDGVRLRINVKEQLSLPPVDYKLNK